MAIFYIVTDKAALVGTITVQAFCACTCVHRIFQLPEDLGVRLLMASYITWGLLLVSVAPYIWVPTMDRELAWPGPSWEMVAGLSRSRYGSGRLGSQLAR